MRPFDFWARKIVKDAFGEEIDHYRCSEKISKQVDNYFRLIRSEGFAEIPESEVRRCLIFLQNESCEFPDFIERRRALLQEKRGSRRYIEILYGSASRFDEASRKKRKPKLTAEQLVMRRISKNSQIKNDQVERLIDLVETDRKGLQDKWSLYLDLSKFPDSIDRLQKIKNLDTPNCREYFVLRYGNDEKWRTKARRCRKFLHTTKEYWISRGFEDPDQIKKAISQRQSEVSRQKTCQFSTRNYEFWVARGKTETEAKEVVAQIQRRDFNFFASKYGYEEGKERLSACIEKRKESWLARPYSEQCEINQSRGRTFSQLVDQFGEDRAKDIMARRLNHSRLDRSSTQADVFFRELDSRLQIADSISNYRGKEYFLLDSQGIIFLDYFRKGRAIEFFGSFWHADPRRFSPEEIHPVHKVSCQEIWKKDFERIRRIQRQRIEVKIIWSDDVLRSCQFDAIIDEIKNFIWRTK